MSVAVRITRSTVVCCDGETGKVRGVAHGPFEEGTVALACEDARPRDILVVWRDGFPVRSVRVGQAAAGGGAR